MSSSGNSPLQYPTTPPISLISDEDSDEVLIPLIRNPDQFLPYTPNGHPITLQLFQQKTPNPDTTETQTLESHGQSDIFRPYDITNQPSSTLFNNPPPPNITTVADGFRIFALHPHPQRNEWVTGCLICGKSYDQVVQETVADYLNRTAQPSETVREREIKRNAFIGGIQSGVFNFLSPGKCRLPPVTA